MTSDVSLDLKMGACNGTLPLATGRNRSVMVEKCTCLPHAVSREGHQRLARESRNGVGVVLCNVNSTWMTKVGERNAEDATYLVEWETHEYGRRSWLKADNSIYVVKFRGVLS